MSKDIPDLVATSTENTTSIINTQNDAFAAFLTIPAGKLDADQYIVQDLDGVNEGVFGSGNMNFLMMQSEQTQATMRSLNPFDASTNDAGANTAAPSTASPYSGESINADLMSLPQNFQGNAPSAYSGSGMPDLQSGNAFSALQADGAGKASLQDSSAALQADRFSAASSQTQTAVNGVNGADGQDGADGRDGSDGTNGSNGQNGDGGGDDCCLCCSGGDTIINIDIITTNITDTVTNIVTNVTENVFVTIEHITENVTEIVTHITENVFNTINNLLDGLNLGPIGLDLGLALDDLTSLNLDLLSGENIFNVINETIDLSLITTPVEDLLGNLAGAVDLSLILDPFQYDSSPDDFDVRILSDLDALGLPVLSALDLDIDIPLDIVEALVGDIDLELDLASDVFSLLDGGGSGLGGVTDLLLGGDGADTDLALDLGGLLPGIPLVPDGVNILLNPVEDLLGDIDISLIPTLDLFGSSETSNAAGDTDIVIPLDLGLADHGLLSQTLSLSLDPVEAITGDIDLDLSVAANILGDVAGNILDPLAGGSDDPNILSQIGDALGCVVGEQAALLDVAGNIFTVTGDAAAQSLNFVDALLAPLTCTVETAIDTLANATCLPGDLQTGILGLDAGAISDLGLWTDSLVPDGGGGLLGGLMQEIGSLLPDPDLSGPIGSVTAPSIISDSLSGLGLGGGKHFGGLFG